MAQELCSVVFSIYLFISFINLKAIGEGRSPKVNNFKCGIQSSESCGNAKLHCFLSIDIKS
jgi:hypothetical protein